MNQLIEIDNRKYAHAHLDPKVLIIDRNPDELMIHLRDLPISLFGAVSIDEAFSSLNDHNFAVALYNPDLQGINGSEISILYEHSKNTELPIVVLAPPSLEIKPFIEISGIFNFIPHPPDPKQLIRLVLFHTTNHLNENVLKVNTPQLELINAELESITYSVSHDLRAPLRAVTGFSSVLLKKASDHLKGDHLRYLNLIVENVDRMNQMINDILSLSRLSRQKKQVQPIDMQSLAKSIFAELTASMDQVPEFILPKLPKVKADKEMLYHVWYQLLENAIRFSANKENPRIEIGSNTINDEIIFYIKDNGIGFEMEYPDKLFQLFQKLHGDEESGRNGSGLAIVKKIIDRHGGKIWAESETDAGATFFFSIPE